MLKNLYGVVEGPDGSGKGEQCDRAERYLESRGFKVLRTIEPGGTPMGDALRLILKNRELERDAHTNVDLFTSSRREGAIQIIRPALALGKVVLSDRNFFSTIAYQCFGEGVDLDYVLRRSSEALGEDCYAPGIGIVLDVPYEVLEERMRGRGGADADFFESKGPEFFRRVLDGYRWVCDNLPATLIDGSGTREETWALVQAEIDQKLGGNHGI